MKSALTLLSLFVVGASHATLINASFEQPVVTGGGYTTDGMPGWNSDGTYGAWNIPSGTFIAIAPPDGKNIGYSNGTALLQLTDDVVDIRKFTLEAAVVRRQDSYSASIDMELWSATGINAAKSAFVGGALLASVSFDIESIAHNSFKDISLTYDAMAGDPNLGKQIGVRFVRKNGSQITVDQVRLNAVPEPTALLGLAAASGAFFLRRRAR